MWLDGITSETTFSAATAAGLGLYSYADDSLSDYFHLLFCRHVACKVLKGDPLTDTGFTAFLRPLRQSCSRLTRLASTTSR